MDAMHRSYAQILHLPPNSFTHQSFFFLRCLVTASWLHFLHLQRLSFHMWSVSPCILQFFFTHPPFVVVVIPDVEHPGSGWLLPHDRVFSSVSVFGQVPFVVDELESCKAQSASYYVYALWYNHSVLVAHCTCLFYVEKVVSNTHTTAS